MKHNYQFSAALPAVLFISLLLFAVSGKSVAQPAEGTVKYVRSQNMTKMIAAVDYMSRQRIERMSYMFGSRPAWQSYSLLYFTPEQTKFEDSEEAVGSDRMGYSGKKEVFFMTRNFGANTLFDAITMLGKVYLVSDTIRQPEWKILNDMKEVAGHICMNAQWNDTLRKQKVIAWFALDLPSKAGPDRFFGLPGLILEADINNGAVVYTAEKIDFGPVASQLKTPAKLKGKKVHQHDYEAVLKKYFDERRQAEEPPFWGIRY